MAKLTFKLEYDEKNSDYYDDVELTITQSDDAGLVKYLSAFKSFLNVVTFHVDNVNVKHKIESHNGSITYIEVSSEDRWKRIGRTKCR